jgi:hypothetical protein
MKFEEAMKYLREGKKIRIASWDQENYFILKTEMVDQFASNNISFLNQDILSNDWEVWE